MLEHIQVIMTGLVGKKKADLDRMEERDRDGLIGLVQRLSYLFPEQAINNGEQAMRARYYAEVRAVAEELMEEAKDNGFDCEEADRWLWETLDGHEWVIYTAKAQMVLMVSENDGAYTNELGDDGVVSNGCLNWSAMAFMAMKCDVQDTLGDLGFDWDNPAGSGEED